MMKHVEFLVEDQSGKAMLEAILPKIFQAEITYNIHSYRGIGRIPQGLSPNTDASKRILLDQLPRLISGYGKAFQNDPPDYVRTVVVVCDLDNRDKDAFEQELQSVVDGCQPKPPSIICVSIEEGEAWLLGDVEAVLTAYPKINRIDLMRYTPDSICGTWEFLADLLEKGGSKTLRTLGYQEVGRAKSRWARAISPKIEIDRNRSPSFQNFVHKLTLAFS